MSMKTIVFSVLFGWFIGSAVIVAQTENDVIINEILNGSLYRDAVELLVLKPGGVDMRGWTITDMSTPSTSPSTTEGYCVFPQNPFLQNVPQFTRIVLVFYKSSTAASPMAQQDTIAMDDSTIVLFAFGPDSLLNSVPAGSGVNLGNNDNVILVAGSNLSSDPVIDAVFYGTSSNSWPGTTWVNNIADIASSQIAYFTNDSTGGLNNNNGAIGKGWFSAVSETQHTLGRINPGQLLGGKPIRISQISRSPVSPDSTQSVTVRAKIGFMNPPVTPRLFYTVNAVTDSVLMTNVSDSTYQGIIPPQSPGRKVYYYIKVTDNASNTAVTSTDSFTVAVPVNITPIATIQANSAAYQNQIVTISGIVVIGDYKLIATRRTVYVVDRSSGVNGIQIFSQTFSGDTLKRGDSVVVTGAILDYQGITEITHPSGGSMTINIVSRNNPIPPANNRTVAGISDINKEGEWVRIKGNVTSKSSVGGGDNIVVEDATGIITVRIWNTTGVNTAAIAVNNTYTFTGIIGIYNNATQLLPAYNEDIIPDTAGSGDFTKIDLKVSPYPFNPTSGEVFRYALRYGNDSRIIVRLYDLAGRLVTTLVDQVKSAGRDETKDILDSRVWNGRSTETRQLVPAGTYLMHLEVTNRKTGKSQYKTAPVVIGTKLK